MKHRENRFKSSFKPSRLLKFMSSALVLICVTFWIFRDKLGFETSDLFILTGFTILVVDMAYMNSQKNKKNIVFDKHLEKNREEIGHGDYNSDIFYDK